MNAWRENIFARVVVSVSALVAGLAPVAMSDAAIVHVIFNSPTLDRWNYPFAGNPGGNSYAAIFAPLTTAGFDPSFDNRDGQMVIGYNTSGQVTPQLGPGRYVVQSATVTLTVETGGSFGYDTTPDSYRTWLAATDPQFVADNDAGHAVELFGTWLRNGLTSATYTESAAYSPLGSFGKGIRSAFAAGFNSAGQCVDVSNNVDARVDPVPFAVGLNN